MSCDPFLLESFRIDSIYLSSIDVLDIYNVSNFSSVYCSLDSSVFPQTNDKLYDSKDHFVLFLIFGLLFSTWVPRGV